jgi:tetratricopeptide (TPR) repeat protein
LDAQAATQKLWNNCASADPDTSIEACTKILRGKESRKHQAVALSNRAYSYIKKDQFDEAIADATKAIERDPKYVYAHDARATGYYRKNDHDRAIADYARAIEVDPKFASAFSSRASAYTRVSPRSLSPMRREPSSSTRSRPTVTPSGGAPIAGWAITTAPSPI